MRERERWAGSLGFVLAAAGSAIGLGNLWKFPFITWENRGGAFVLVYLICICAVGLPIMMAEILIGRRTQKSPVGAMKEVAGPAWGVVGGWGVLCGFILCSYYSVVAGWSIYYLGRTLGWSLGGFPPDIQSGALFDLLAANGAWQLLLSGFVLLTTAAVIYVGVRSGIERVARTSLPILFAILVLMLLSALRMEGSGEALAFLFRPNFGELEPKSVLEALGHSFFTLSLGMGAMITYGSYMAKDQSIVRTSAAIVVLDTVVALMACAIMYSVIFSVPGLDAEVSGSAVGMLFISLPRLFYEVVPFGVLLAPLFYLLVALAALTSLISILEVVASYLIDERAIARHRAVAISASTVFVFMVPAALSLGAVPALSGFELFSGKLGWFSTADHFVANWMLPTGGLGITVAAGWVMARGTTREDLVDNHTPRWFRYGAWRFAIRFASPAAVLAVLVAAMFFGFDFS